MGVRSPRSRALPLPLPLAAWRIGVRPTTRAGTASCRMGVRLPSGTARASCRRGVRSPRPRALPLGGVAHRRSVDPGAGTASCRIGVRLPSGTARARASCRRGVRSPLPRALPVPLPLGGVAHRRSVGPRQGHCVVSHGRPVVLGHWHGTGVVPRGCSDAHGAARRGGGCPAAERPMRRHCTAAVTFAHDVSVATFAPVPVEVCSSWTLHPAAQERCATATRLPQRRTRCTPTPSENVETAGCHDRQEVVVAPAEIAVVDLGDFGTLRRVKVSKVNHRRPRSDRPRCDIRTAAPHGGCRRAAASAFTKACATGSSHTARRRPRP
jgi:hypothetical protein